MSNQSQLTKGDVDTLTQAGIIPHGTPDAQVRVFATLCRDLRLNPYAREIHLTQIGGKYNPIIGINGLRRIAANSGTLAGTDDVKFDIQPDGKYLTGAQLKGANKLPTTATVTVYRMIQGQRCAFTATVQFNEFSSGRNNWQSMPFQMIGKVAEAFAIRKGFSDYVSGVHIEEEEHAIEVITKAQSEVLKARISQAHYLIEQCTSLTDEQENAARIELSRDDITEARVIAVIERLRELMPPSADPRQQNKQRAK